MATIRIYCDCKVKELGIAVIDLYSLCLPYDLVLQLMNGTAKCKHCGQQLKKVKGTPHD